MLYEISSKTAFLFNDKQNPDIDSELSSNYLHYFSDDLCNEPSSDEDLNSARTSAMVDVKNPSEFF